MNKENTIELPEVKYGLRFLPELEVLNQEEQKADQPDIPDKSKADQPNISKKQMSSLNDNPESKESESSAIDTRNKHRNSFQSEVKIENKEPEFIEKDPYSHLKLSDLENIRKRMEVQNQDYIRSIHQNKSEIEKIDRSLAQIKPAVENEEKRIKNLPEKNNKLKAQNQSLLNEINQIKLKTKAAHEDKDNTHKLKDTLLDELESIRNEKIMLIDRIAKMEELLKQLSEDKQQKLPHLRKYDHLLKKAYNVIRETENRMEISLTVNRVK
ncbi:Mad26 [Candidatus Magnetomoraceae bacterium gMMP-15]